MTTHCVRERQRTLEIRRVKRDEDRIGAHAGAVLVRRTFARKRFATPTEQRQDSCGTVVSSNRHKTLKIPAQSHLVKQ
jgi:hypothetical protein